MHKFSDFVDMKYRPVKNDLVCRFYVEPAPGIPLKVAAGIIASESSVGTWTKVKTQKHYVKEMAARVFSMKGSEIEIAYPAELFEYGNVPQILSSVAGNVFGMKAIRNLRLEDISFPAPIVKSYKGPKYGIAGVRKLTKVRSRPLLGTIIKPKLGLNTKDHAEAAFNAWSGGCDLVKDDENLTNQKFNPFEKRLSATLRARDKAEKETGERKMYLPNVTAETKEMLRRARFVRRKLGGEYVMIDILTCGFSALQSLRAEGLNLVIHAHRAMHGAITRNEKHGISMLVLAKIARLIGVDQLHIGTVVGKMEGRKSEVEEVEDDIEMPFIGRSTGKSGHVLEQDWCGIKPVFAVCSGGLHPVHVPRLMHMLGNNIIIQMGGGIHGHPEGTSAGAAATRQAIDAAMENKGLIEYAHMHSELRHALEKWAI